MDGGGRAVPGAKAESNAGAVAERSETRVEARLSPPLHFFRQLAVFLSVPGNR